MLGLTRTDKLLLWTLLPLFSVVLFLHSVEVARTGLAYPPVFARPVAGDAYPMVGGLRLERGSEWNDLEVGDRLIRIGEVDLRGAGYLSFDATALEQAGPDLRAPLTIERDGVTRELDLVMRSHTISWFRIPPLLCLALTGLLVLLRSPGVPHSQHFFKAALGFAILELRFMGGPWLQTYVALLIFNFGGSIALFWMLRWVIALPGVPDRDRPSPRWAWWGGLYLLVRLNYMLPTPVPSEVVPYLTLGSDAFQGALLLAIATWNYVHATPVGRRRVKWALYGGYIGSSPMILALLVAVLAPSASGGLAFHRMFEYSGLAFTVVPLGLLIGAVRFNLFDIDRLISSTASYSITLVAGLGAAFAAIPAAARTLSAATGASESPLQIALSLALAAVLVPLNRRLSPFVERLFFPERRVQEEGIERLLRDLPQCRGRTEVLELVRDRLAALLQPESCRLLRASATGLSSEAGPGEPPEVVLGRRSPVVLDLTAEPAPMTLVQGERSRRVESLPAADREQLRSWGLEILAPLRSGNDLAAVVALGARRSGDVYTSTDLAALHLVCEKASGELSRLRDEQVIARERGRGDELQAGKAEAENVNAARSRFLAAASHDLRQPLHAMSLFAETIGRRVTDPEDRTTLERMKDSTRALGTMFDALLDVSRLDAGAVEPRLSDFELGPILARLVAENEERARSKGLSLSFEASAVGVRSDPVLLTRIVQNLLGNAIRYTEDGSVRVRCMVEGEGVQILVADTGPGIPEERRAEIFREFTRLGPKASDGGLGLGLSIVDRMCRLLGHDLRLESELGKGSTFSLRVPLAIAASAPAPAALFEPSLRGRLIVVIDDDLPVLESTGRLLGQWHGGVVLAVSAAEALESLRAHDRSPDAILADYRLGNPRETGLDAVDEIRSFVGHDIPAAIISGETAPEILAAIHASGLVHLVKPVPPSKLRALLVELLRDRPSRHRGWTARAPS